MPEILAITFAAFDFPVDGAPSLARADAAARSFAATGLRGVTNLRLQPTDEGVDVLVPEPYPLVGQLKAVPAGQGDVSLLGQPRPRAVWEGTYLADNRVVLNADPLAPDARN